MAGRRKGEEEGEKMGRRGDEEEEEEEGGESHACLCVRPFGPSQEEKQEGLRAKTPPPPYHLRAR